MSLSGKLGQLLLCVFALPFALGGVFIISQVFRMSQPDFGKAPFWLGLVLGLILSGVGFGLMFATIYGGRLVQRKNRIEAEHPNEPWLWREDWAQGRANSNTRNSMLAGWVFALFWNAVSVPVALLALPAAAKQKGPGVYVALIFPIIGVFLLIRAIRQTIGFFEFGKTYFEMTTLPGVIGRDLRGQIQARFPHSPDHGVHLRLSSVHRFTTGSGNSRSTTESILYRDEADLSSGQLCPGPTGTTIPVAFRIPLDAQQTRKLGPNDEFVWLLEALADVPGVDYHDIFEVPVFRTQQTPTREEAERFAVAAPTQAVRRPDVTTIQVGATSEGTEFYFPAARNKNFALSSTIFMVVFGSVTVFLAYHAPIIFPLAFGFFAIVLVYITIQQWFGTSRVVISNSGLAIQAGLMGGGRVRQIPFSEIGMISDKITAQQGGATGIPYYDIELTSRDGKKLTLGRSVRNKNEAEWLVSEMRRLTGLDRKSMAAGMA